MSGDTKREELFLLCLWGRDRLRLEATRLSRALLEAREQYRFDLWRAMQVPPAPIQSLGPRVYACIWSLHDHGERGRALSPVAVRMLSDLARGLSVRRPDGFVPSTEDELRSAEASADASMYHSRLAAARRVVRPDV